MAASPAEIPLYTPTPNRWQANWFVVLFGLPFAGIGLHVIAMGVRGLLGENPGTPEVMQVSAGFVFAAMGSTAVYLGFEVGRASAERAERQARHPAEPWRWRADWAAGRIPCEGRATALGFLAFAIIWNAFCIPLLWAVPSSGAPFVWIFVIVGMGLASLAGLATWRWLRFGRSLLELATLPGRPGDRLRGAIHLNSPLQPANGFRATLTCTGFTSGRNGQEHILWQEEGLIPAAAATLGPKGLAVPVDFPIPAGLGSSHLPGTSSGILWRVDLTADLPGVDFAASFEVPVFHTDAAQPSHRHQAAAAATSLGPVLQPEAPMVIDRERYTPDSPNRLRLLAAGGVEVRLSTARNKWHGLFFVGFTFCWSFFAALAWFAAPLLFGILFVAGWVLLICSCIILWLRNWRIVADLSGVQVTSRILGICWRRRVPANAIEKIVPQIVGQWGKRPLYDLRIHRTGGRPVKTGDGLRSKREAEWLCAALWRAVRGSSGDEAAVHAARNR